MNARKKLAAYINSKNYDVVITSGRIALWLAMMAPYLNCKTIGWQHSTFDAYVNQKGHIFWNQECLLQEYLPKLNAFVVLSPFDKRDYKEKLGIDAVAMSNPRSFTSELKTDCEKKHFLMVTRFEYAKGVDLAVEAFKEFAKYDDEWDLEIVGSGTQFKKIQQLIKKEELVDRIHLYGYSNNPQEFYLNSSILLMPSRWEGWGMTILEGYEFGLPVIAFRVSSMELVIKEGKTGLLADAFDTTQFAQAMLKLSGDDELRKTMHINALEESDCYDIKKIEKDWEQLIETI